MTIRRYKYKKDFPKWNSDLAYVVGIIATDGNLSSNGRHINITSKDLEMVLRIKRLLKLKNKIGRKARGGVREKKYYLLQFGDVCFYDFLLSVGLTPAKSKTLEKLSIPTKYFHDFLRGCIDGDGSIGSFIHPESKLVQSRVRLVSASPRFLNWILVTIRTGMNIHGGWIYSSKKSVHILAFGKNDTRKILKMMYYKKSLPALRRKRLAAEKIMGGW
jgi:hypothetical protein